MKAKIIFFSILLIMILTVSSWLAISITKNMLDENRRTQGSSDFFMRDVVYTQVDDNGVVQEQLHSTKMVHYPITSTYVFDSPRLVMTDKDNKQWYISANNASSKGNSKEIYLWDDVNIKQQQDKSSLQGSMSIITSAATLYPKQQMAETDKPLTIVQGGNVVNAIGAKVDLRNSKVKLLSRVKGKYEANKGGSESKDLNENASVRQKNKGKVEEDKNDSVS